MVDLERGISEQDRYLDVAEDDGASVGDGQRPPKPRRNVIRALDLKLTVTDPEVLAELQQRAEGPERDQYAAAALRLGVLSLRMATGQVDTTAMKAAADNLLLEVRALLTQRAEAMTSTVAQSLTSYLDPKTGALPQRLEALVKRDGELEKLLRLHLGPQDSVLAKSLTQHLGEGSPIFKLLSPTDANGLKAQLEKLLATALCEQRSQVLKQFSLDEKDSAVNRLIEQIAKKQGALAEDFAGQVNGVVKELDIKSQTSALSVLLRRVQEAEQAIHQHLTLDEADSALARLKKELQDAIEKMAQRNATFQADVQSTLAQLAAKKQADAKTTAHGLEFEARLGEVLGVETARTQDVLEAVGHLAGTISRCKTGDYVVTLSSDSRAPGANIVFEAKESKGYTLKDALKEIDEARRNRSAQIGVFVFSKKTAPEELEAFTRYGESLVVVWDAEDPAADVLIKAALSTAKALCVATAAEKEGVEDAVQEAEAATRAIEKAASNLADIKKFAETSLSSAEKIIDRAERMRKALEQQVTTLDDAVNTLKEQ